MSDRRVSQQTWLKVAKSNAWAEQGHCCYYCKSPIKRTDVTADHVKSKKFNGSDLSYNIVAACLLCNRAKRHKDVKTFKKELTKPCYLSHRDVMLAALRYRLEKRIKKAEARVRGVE